MSYKGLILVTGINGFIAARTAEAFLKGGYSVRGTVRSKSSADAIVAALSQYAEKLEIVEVPDITAPGGFDAALKGVVGVAHLAAPVSMFFTEADPVIKTATSATLNILESAAKQPSIKSFVLMSSITAVRYIRDGPYVFSEKDWNDQAEQLIAKMGNDAPGPVIYSASKAAAERVFWKFRDEKKPSFSMTAINPAFVTGPPLVTPLSKDKVSETIEYIWEVFSGQEIPAPLAGFAWFVDVRDVARLVVFGIDEPEKSNGERFVLSAVYGPPQAAADILRKAYPERQSIIKAGNPGEGYLPGYKAPGDQDIDGTKAVKATGQDYLSYEKSVVDAAKMFEPLL